LQLQFFWHPRQFGGAGWVKNNLKRAHLSTAVCQNPFAEQGGNDFRLRRVPVLRYSGSPFQSGTRNTTIARAGTV
jgi:hypothetical protein